MKFFFSILISPIISPSTWLMQGYETLFSGFLENGNQSKVKHHVPLLLTAALKSLFNLNHSPRSNENVSLTRTKSHQIRFWFTFTWFTLAAVADVKFQQFNLAVKLTDNELSFMCSRGFKEAANDANSNSERPSRELWNMKLGGTRKKRRKY